MTDNELSRRTLLRTCAGAAGFAALGSLSGCSGGGNNGGKTTGTQDPSGKTTESPGSGPNSGGSVDVPAAAQAIVQVNVSETLNDQNIREVVNTFLGQAAKQEGYTGPSTVQEALDSAKQAGDIDPQGLHSMTTYMKVDGTSDVQGYTGILMQTDWTAQQLIDSAENQNADVTKGSYKGVTTYSSQANGTSGLFAVLGDGTFALGTETAVKDAIDVSTGNADPLSGDLATYFADTNDGHLRFASMVPEDQLPQQDSGQVNIDGLDKLRYLSGSFYSQSSNLGVDINMHTTDEKSASELADSLDALLQTASMTSDNEDVNQIIDQVEFSANGSTATMVYVESVTQIDAYVEKYAAQLFGMSVGGGMAAGTSAA
ncbi:MAG: hypothetical protein ABEI57_05425 [Halapricum sp.]